MLLSPSFSYFQNALTLIYTKPTEICNSPHFSSAQIGQHALQTKSDAHALVCLREQYTAIVIEKLRRMSIFGHRDQAERILSLALGQISRMHTRHG